MTGWNCLFRRTVSFALAVGCLALIFSLGTTAGWAQSASTGTVSGIVTDPSGAVLVDALVTLTDVGTGDSRTANTNDTGRFFIANVSPGKYDISITKKGFAAAKLTAQQVEVGKSVNVNVSLPVGTANEIVEVESSNIQLQTMNATVGNTITGISLEALPSLGRDVSSF